MKKVLYQSCDEYIQDFGPGVQTLLQQIRHAVQKAAPGAPEVIRYNMPAFILKNGLVYFGAYKHHIGFYPAPVGITEFAADVARFGSGKGSLKFPLNAPLPLDLVTRIALYKNAD